MNSLLKMSIRNIMRNPRRTVLTGTAIGIVVFVLTFGVCYIFGIMNELFDNFVAAEAGHLKIYHQGYSDKEMLLPLELTLVDSPALADAARGVDGVEAVSERLKFFSMLDFEGTNDFAIGYGIDPEGDRGIGNLYEKVKFGTYFTEPQGQIMVGSGLAEKFGIETGDVVSVISQEMFGINLDVVGIFEYGFYMDEKFFYITLADARYLLDMEDMASEIVIIVDDKDKAPAYVGPLRGALEGITDVDEIEILPWQAQGFLYEMFQIAKYGWSVMLVILFFLAGSTIVNTMMMAVMERTREIGMLMALGMKAREVMISILVEAGSIGVIAGVAGAILGSILAYVLEQTGIPLGDATKGVEFPMGDVFRPILYWWAPPLSLAFGILITFLSTLWPARRASKFDPVKALRSV